MVRVRGQKKLNFTSRLNVKVLLLWVIGFAIIGGVAALYLTQGATPVVVDSTLPRPSNVQVFGDDRVLTATWNHVNSDRVVGYYITYKKKGASTIEGVKQTEDNMVQIQPVVNGQEYEVTVQSAAGTYVRYDNTGIGEGSQNQFARGDGKVSQAANASGTPSDAKVVAQRQRLTGFFDDFNTPANPFDELKWNSAATGCAETSTAGAFINPQYHAHNTIRSGWCDRGGQASRPRAIFDTTVGVNGGPISESNPAQIEFDIDGVTQGRDTWYLDIIPTDSRKNGIPLDITSHNDLFHEDTEDPGNILRINPVHDGFGIVYYDTNRVATNLPVINPNTACVEWWMGKTKFAWDACNMTNKVSGLSPLPQPSNNPDAIANVRRHWVVQLTPTKVRVFIDSVMIAEADLPPAFAAKNKFYLHSTLFSYNTGKDHNPDWGHRAYPYVQMFHWDNFGFTGPAPNTVTHNYIDGGPDGRTPTYFLNQGPDNRSPRGNRTTIIPIPDDIGNPVNDRGILLFTIQTLGWQQYTWAAGDHVLFNGKRYDLPDPRLNMNNPPSGELVGSITPHATGIYINKSDIVKGNNTVQFRFTGSGENRSVDFINVHFELTYTKNNAPSYTQPIQIFGQNYSRIVEPRLTNCDSYTSIEQDLGLAYTGGKANLAVGPCVLFNTLPSHHPDFFGTPVQQPNPDQTLPVVNLTAPANNATITNNSIAAAATASDNVAVSAVEFYIGGVLQATDNAAPYEATLNFTSLSPGTYGVYAIARDTAGNIAQTSAVNVVKPVPPDTTLPTISLTAPTNNTTVQSGASTLTTSANASDNVGVTRVDFYVDGALYAQDSTAPYSAAIQLGSLSSGAHTVFARAYDAAGNMRQSSTNNFTIPTPPPATCPVGQIGTPPNCTVPAPETCPEGQTGTPPNCTTPTPPPTPNPAPNKPGDISGDGVVNRTDLRIVLVNYGRTVPASTNGDLNGDGKVDRSDFRILILNYGK